MRKGLVLLMVATTCCLYRAQGQSMHFTQYYNAPQLLNPANTALTPDLDYRLGANYRNQWAALPVPFNTVSAFGDVKIGANRGEGDKWLGLGGAIYSDKAGSGSLSLFQAQLSLAYHLHVSKTSMLSVGLAGSYSQRSVDYDKLTFDNQWDGISFNTYMPTGEKVGVLKTTFMSVAAGVNYAYMPNEAAYVKVGIGVANINQPVESFYGGKNQVGMRPIANVDMLFRTSDNIIINPSAYYTTQKGAAEIVAGSSMRINMTGPNERRASQLILGGYFRVGDAVIGTLGYQYGNVQFTGSYDFTVSGLAPYNAAYGALEFSIICGGNSNGNEGARKMYACPRFN